MSGNNLQNKFSDYVIKNKESHYRFVYSYVKNVDDALDIVQEAIYKAISSIDSLKGKDHIKPWFYRILANTSLDFLRKQRKIETVDEEVLSGLKGGRVDNYQDFDLQKAMEDLPSKYRSVIILRYFEDLKIEEIAEVLNENVNTVKTRLYKSLEKLRISIDGLE
jgi:RNA polymerase sigma-70 factor, ECF subfamily